MIESLLVLTPTKIMMKKITFNVPNLRYGLCAGLVCLLFALSVEQVPAEADRKAGERMTVTIKDV